MSFNSKIGLLGGAFDPPHLGHLEMAKLAHKQFQLEKVIFIPSSCSLGKPSPFFSPKERLQMLDLMIADLSWAKTSDFEIQKGGVSYTYETANYFQKTFPQSSLFCLLGSDQWDAIDTWKRYRDLAKILEFIVFSRNLKHSGNFLEKKHFISHFIFNFSYPISSSLIRESLSNLKKYHSYLHPQIIRFISEKHLSKNEKYL